MIARCELARAHAMSDPGLVNQHHSIDYIELSVTDVAAAKAFYEAAFGWQFRDYGDDYAGIVGLDREVGGLRRVETVTRGGPLVVLFSLDLEGSLANVESAGGEITSKPFAFPGGRRFHFADPSGNELAVWSES